MVTHDPETPGPGWEDSVLGNLVNRTPPPYVFRKSMSLKRVKAVCFDRLL